MKCSYCEILNFSSTNMKNLLLAVFLVASPCSYAASVVQNAKSSEMEDTVSALLSKVKEQQQRITQLESMLQQHLQTSSQGNNHNKRAFSFPVAFSANLANTQITHSKGTIVRFDHVTVNDGGGYKASSGVFIAPEAGLYFFTWMFLPEPGYAGSMAFYKNGEILRYSDSTTTMAGNSVVVRLNSEDQVWLATYRNVDGIHQNHSAFSGFRISD